MVEDVEPDAERNGLSRSQLQAEVKSRLQQAGIKVASTSENYLYVHLHALKSKDSPVYAYNIPLYLMYYVSIWMARLFGRTPGRDAADAV